MLIHFRVTLVIFGSLLGNFGVALLSHFRCSKINWCWGGGGVRTDNQPQGKTSSKERKLKTVPSKPSKGFDRTLKRFHVNTTWAEYVSGSTVSNTELSEFLGLNEFRERTP